MAERAPINCDYPDCRAAVPPGTKYCPKHTQQPADKEAQRNVERQRTRNEPWRAWYHRKPWTGPNGLRLVVLARDPICCVCGRNASTIADHIRPHRGIWSLFVDLLNLQGLCAVCHSTKTAKEDAGFGNAAKDVNAPVPTGDSGRQFVSTTVGDDALDRALAAED